MGRRDVLLSWLGSPVVRVVEPAVEQAVERRTGRDAARLTALEERIEQLSKKLAMVTGTVQATTERATGAQETATEALATARQAMQVATTARATAEAAADADEIPARDGCRVAECTGPHRARGFCAAHYNRWRRGVLDGFVGPQGTVRHAERSWTVDPVFAGDAVAVDGDLVRVNGRTVPARTA